MKYLKLFEDFGSSRSGVALVKATADWSGIRADGQPEEFIFPSSVNVEYITNPTGQQIENAYIDSPASTAIEVVEAIASGDQNGTNLYQSNPLYVLVDSGVSPREIESDLRMVMKQIDDTLVDMAEDILSDPVEYTPEFISHCEDLLNGGKGTMKRNIRFVTR